MSFHCSKCDRSFNHDPDLQQHIRDSPRHGIHKCEPCNRTFSSQDALGHHTRDSPAHAPSFDCEVCDESFGSQDALDRHTRDSPAHAPSFDCEACDQSFGSQDDLEQHTADQHPATPLDAFFSSFPTFAYDSKLLPNTSYKNLENHMRWRRNDPAAKAAWRGYQAALEGEVQMWFGAQDSLIAWHALCRAIGIKPLPETCAQGRKAARKRHVNIVDLIAWGRSDRSQEVQTFRTVEKLRVYTRETGKVFSFDEASRNAVLKHLRRQIFYTG